MTKILAVCFSLVVLSTEVYAKDTYLHFDTYKLPKEEISSIGIDKTSEKISLIRIDNLFHGEVLTYEFSSAPSAYFTSTEFPNKPLIELSAKEHLLEFSCLGDKKLFTTTVNIEPQKKYLIKYLGGELTMVDGQGIETSLEYTDAPRYIEPEDGVPYSTLLTTKKIMKNEGSFSLIRIDNLAGEYFKNIADFRITQHYIPYSIKITPGPHTIKYTISYAGMSSTSLLTLTYNFEENKKYKICLVDPKDTQKTGRANVQIVVTE